MHNVFANMWQVAAKAGMNKSIARFPDVCLSPPSPPAGPIPIPYPDTAFSSDLKDGSSTVKIAGKPVALAQKSFYKPSVLGNEAATRSFGASVITHQITGKTYFQAWSMDVKVEGKNVCRHIDITTSNHGSQPGATPPLPTNETQTLAEAELYLEAGVCPCCLGHIHKWQKDQNGRPFTPMKESDFWDMKVAAMKRGSAKARANYPDFAKKLWEHKAAKQKARAAAAAGKPGCPNVHPNEESGCALYFYIPAEFRHADGSTPAQIAGAHFTKKSRRLAVRAWKPMFPEKVVPAGTTFHHKTPRMAGGCNSPGNVVPDPMLSSPECRAIEDSQSFLEKVDHHLPQGQ